MAAYGVGAQPNISAQQFMTLMAPIHLPSLISTDGQDTTHLPQHHHVAALEVVSTIDVLPLRTGYDFGTAEDFTYLTNNNEIFTGVTLCVKLAGLSVGAGFINPRYVDDVLCAAMEKIEFFYGSNNPLQCITGDELHFRLMQELKSEELERRYDLQAAGLSVLERTNAAMNPQWVYLEIPFWWARAANANWHAYALGRPTRIRITWRSSRYLVQCDRDPAVLPPLPAVLYPAPVGSATYMMEKFLRFDTVVPAEATKMAYIKMVEAQENHGWLHLIQDWQSQEFLQDAIPAGTLSQVWRMKVDMFNKYGYNLRFVIRPTANLVDDPLNNRRWEIRELKDKSFEISNKQFSSKVDDFYGKHHIDAIEFLGNPEINVYNIPFTRFPDMHSHGMGGLEFSNAVLPTLVVTMGSRNPDGTDGKPAMTVTCWLECHNYVRVVIKGTQSGAEIVQPI